jgi:hypothetical protein
MALCLGKVSSFPNKVERFQEIVEASGSSGYGGRPAIGY